MRRNLSRREFNKLAALCTGVAVLSPRATSQTAGLSFRYAEGTPTGVIRTHQAKLAAVSGQVYAYATFQMGGSNPRRYVNGQPPGVQILALGNMTAGRFVPAVRFGLQDGQGLPGDQAQLVPWVSDGRQDYYGGYARPNTPYDFKLKLDLPRRRMTVWTSGRGDDDWFMLVEDRPFTFSVLDTALEISEVRVEQYPDAQGISDLHVGPAPWGEGERVRPHPLAKQDRVVKPNAGFRFKSMSSLWQEPGRHVTISRDQTRWQGFPDVVCTDSGKLLITYCDGDAHGGGGKAVLRVSNDLGKTWGPEKMMVPTGGSSERLQKLRDGSILYISGEEDPVVEFKRSRDEGETWEVIGGFDVRTLGLPVHYMLSHVLERSDGAWLTTGSDLYPPPGPLNCRERLQIYRSLDSGKTWGLLTILDLYPSSGHEGSESSLLELPGGRLVIYSRETRSDGYPGFRVFSEDKGKTWSHPEDLPIQVVGRVRAGFLPDGRILLTTRNQMGRPALWAWVEDPQAEPGFKISGAHFSDHFSKGLKDGIFHIDNDGHCGQFTRYHLRPPEAPESQIELTVEVLVKENRGRAATISIPFAGRLRIFPDRLDFAGRKVTSVPITPGMFHTFRVLLNKGQLKIFVDDELKLETSELDDRRKKVPYTPVPACPDVFAFGNETAAEEAAGYERGFGNATTVYPPLIVPEVTGLSLWKSVKTRETTLMGVIHEVSWVAATDGFPDQYQLDHVIEIEATVFGTDQGYSGWTLLPDGRILVVNYTDDTSVYWPASSPTSFRCPWIRGTYVLPSDLPRSETKLAQSRQEQEDSLSEPSDLNFRRSLGGTREP